MACWVMSKVVVSHKLTTDFAKMPLQLSWSISGQRTQESRKCVLPMVWTLVTLGWLGDLHKYAYNLFWNMWNRRYEKIRKQRITGNSSHFVFRSTARLSNCFTLNWQDHWVLSKCLSVRCGDYGFRTDFTKIYNNFFETLADIKTQRSKC